MANYIAVFLSSTAKDLQKYRDAVTEGIAKASGYHCERMEDFPPGDETIAYCKARIAGCEIYVGLIGHLHGSRPPGSESSFTEIEYEEAKKRDKPRLIYMADKDFPIPASLIEPADAFERQRRFRERLKSAERVVPFSDPQELTIRVITGLNAVFQFQSAPAILSKLGGGRERGTSDSELRADEAALTGYLNRLVEQTGFLELGTDRGIRLPLHAVYTALMALSPPTHGGRAGGDEAPRPGLAGGKPKQLVPASDQVSSARRLVLLGEPGTGKSTFVNFVALCLAGELLGRRDINVQFLTQPLPEGQGRGAAVPKLWERRSLLPIRVALHDFAARGLGLAGVRPTADSLWEYIRGDLVDAGLGHAFALVKHALLTGGGLLLLDGLDEVPEAGRLRARVCRVLADFCSTLGESHVLVTSRPYAYQERATLAGFESAVLAPFSKWQIDRFIEAWYRQMVDLGRLRNDDARGRAELLRRDIFRSERLLGLAQAPLLLTMMASLQVSRGGRLPDRREQLYAEAVELILNTRERRRLELDESGTPLLPQPSLAEWLVADRQEVRLVLEKLAFEAQLAQRDLSGTGDVDEDRLVDELLALSRNPTANAVQLVEYLRDRAGLLVARGKRTYTFAHRTFQEYLAACYLTGESFPDEAARLGRESPLRWREAVLLAGAKAARGTTVAIWYLANALCRREPQDEHGSADDWGALLAGQIVAESANLARIPKAQQERFEQLRRWLVYLLQSATFPVRERCAAGRALATLGDSRFDSSRWRLPQEPYMGFVPVPEGPFKMGSEKEEDPMTRDREVPRHDVMLRRYWMARFPVTVGQFRAFVTETGYEPADLGCLDDCENFPVVRVSWVDALAYVEWLGQRLKELGQKLRRKRGDMRPFWADLAAGRIRACLPSEAEWEMAARGNDGRLYPWGNQVDPSRANFRATGLFERNPVGTFPGGASPYGCEEMSGNVWEWTRSSGGVIDILWSLYPYVDCSARESLDAGSPLPRVLRGGAFLSSKMRVRCAFRSRNLPATSSDSIGFRVALSSFPGAAGSRSERRSPSSRENT